MEFACFDVVLALAALWLLGAFLTLRCGLHAALSPLCALSLYAALLTFGGIAGMLGTVRNVNPAMFWGAPRYHTGGVAGLGPNEVPAILQRGEEVLTRQDPRHRYNGGMGGGSSGALEDRVRFVFVDDQRDVGNYLESAQGERAIVRIMQRNPRR